MASAITTRRGLRRHTDPGARMQTGEYSTKIFSLAVLLSSLFVYNQMGGIDEASLDRLSLVTEVSVARHRTLHLLTI